MRPPHWHCDTHGDFDAMRAVGCPECMREARMLLRRWERLAADLKPQTRDALFEFNSLLAETGAIHGQ
jgi:hypothetical protein